VTRQDNWRGRRCNAHRTSQIVPGEWSMFAPRPTCLRRRPGLDPGGRRWLHAHAGL